MRLPLVLLSAVLASAALADRPGDGTPGMARVVDSPALKAAFEAASAGEVELLFDVGADGRVVNPRVVRSQPSGVFDAAALAMVTGQQVHPAASGGPSAIRHDQRLVVRFRADATPQADVKLGE